jgi:uncharacterized protein (DUF983 family)
MLSADQALPIAGRALRLRCPRCGKGKFTRSWFHTNPRCDVCMMQFDREEGYWTGSIFVNLILAQFLIIGGMFYLMFGTALDLWTSIGILAAGAIIFPTFFHPFSRSIWLAMDYFFTTTPGVDPPVRL